MRKILIATSNPGKKREAIDILKGHDVELLTLADFPEVPSIEEDGDTFEENAAIKAKYYFEKTGLPTIADDGGIQVDALNGAPGIRSHRWLGPDATDMDLALGILEKLKGIPREKRGAHLGSCTAFYDGKNLFTSTHFNDGYIADEMAPEGSVNAGLPYRYILILSKFGKLYADLTPEEHASVNHRYANLKELLPHILEDIQGT